MRVSGLQEKSFTGLNRSWDPGIPHFYGRSLIFSGDHGLSVTTVVTAQYGGLSGGTPVPGFYGWRGPAERAGEEG